MGRSAEKSSYSSTKQHSCEYQLENKSQQGVEKFPPSNLRSPTSEISSNRRAPNNPSTPASQKDNNGGAVTITLHTTKDDFDEKAEVKVKLSNPDAVVEKMLHTLAHKFPPESVMTIATHNGIYEESSSSGSSSGATPSSSYSGLSPIAYGLHKANRLSGRHYLGPNGEYYPELADSKGRPIAGYVRDSHTGGALPVGCAAFGPDGRHLPGMIIGPDRKPIPGVPVPSDGLDQSGRPWPCYEAIDGSYPQETIGPDGRSLLGFAFDSVDGSIKRVGPAVVGPDGVPMKGMIRGPDGKPIPGIPLKPVKRLESLLSQHSTKHFTKAKSHINNQPIYRSVKEARVSPRYDNGRYEQTPSNYGFAYGSHHMDSSRLPMTTPRNAHSGISVRHDQENSMLPNYTALDGTRLPIAQNTNGQPMIGFAIDPMDSKVKPVGKPCYDESGRFVPGYIISHGSRIPGIPIILTETTSAVISRQLSNVSHNVSHISNAHPGTQTYHGQSPRAPSAHAQNTPHSGMACTSTDIRIPAPNYPLLDGSYASLAVGPDGRPIDGYGQDPNTGDILPVGRAYYSSDGQPMENMIIGHDGRPTRGLPLSRYGWDSKSQQPLPNYLTHDSQWAPMYIDPEGHLIHGWAKDNDGQIKPVGLQSIDENGRATPGVVIGPDGRVSQGIPLHTDDMDVQSNITNCRNNYKSTQQQMQNNGDDNEMVVRYVEVPVMEEKIVEVPRREYREVEKRVPKKEIVEIVKEVQVPQVQVVLKHVEVPQIEQVIREVRVKQVVDRPYEVLIHKPKIETKIIEKMVEVPGNIVEVPRVERYEQPVHVPNYINKEVPTVVAQKLRPVIRQVSKVRQIPCTITEPKVVTVDVFIPKPVVATLGVGTKVGESHKTVDIPAAQFNALTRRLNISLDESHIASLFVKEGAGVPILPAGERVETVEPVSNEWAATHNVGKVHCSTGTEIPYIEIRETLGLDNNDAISFSNPEEYSFTPEDVLSTLPTTSDHRQPNHHRHHRHHRHYRRYITEPTESMSTEVKHHHHGRSSRGLRVHKHHHRRH